MEGQSLPVLDRPRSTPLNLQINYNSLSEDVHTELLLRIDIRICS